MKPIFVVMRSIGEYSDRTEDPVRAFSSKVAAQECIERSTEIAKACEAKWNSLFEGFSSRYGMLPSDAKTVAYNENIRKAKEFADSIKGGTEYLGVGYSGGETFSLAEILLDNSLPLIMSGEGVTLSSQSLDCQSYHCSPHKKHKQGAVEDS